MCVFSFSSIARLAKRQNVIDELYPEVVVLVPRMVVFRVFGQNVLCKDFDRQPPPTWPAFINYKRVPGSLHDEPPCLN